VRAKNGGGEELARASEGDEKKPERQLTVCCHYRQLLRERWELLLLSGRL